MLGNEAVWSVLDVPARWHIKKFSLIFPLIGVVKGG